MALDISLGFNLNINLLLTYCKGYSSLIFYSICTNDIVIGHSHGNQSGDIRFLPFAQIWTTIHNDVWDFSSIADCNENAIKSNKILCEL